MDIAARIPAELWNDVFERLFPEDLQCVRLVDHLFHRLSSPLLFHTFRFPPHIDLQLAIMSATRSSDDQEVAPPPPDEVVVTDHALARLKIWSSPAVASLVRVCTISTPGGSLLPSLGLPVPREIDPMGLSSLTPAFFQALEHFTNLHHFTANWVHMSEFHLAKLCLLPRLTAIHTTMCTLDCVAVDDFPSTLKLSSFASCDNMFESGAADQWVHALCPDTLQDLSIQSDLLPKIIDLQYTFPHVRTLTVKGLNLSTINGGLPFLSKFPAVQTITLELRGQSLTASEYGGSIDAAIDSGVAVSELPSLNNYAGPYHLLRFLPISRLTDLDIAKCYFSSFVSELRTLQKFDNVAMLALDIEDYVDNLDGLDESFPNLRRLAISINTGDWDSPELIDRMRVFMFFKQLTDHPSLPVNLEQFDIFWIVPVQNPFAVRESTVLTPNDLRKAKDTLLLRHSTLTKLRLSCADYILFWGRKLDGKECCEVLRTNDTSSGRIYWSSDRFWDSDKV